MGEKNAKVSMSATKQGAALLVCELTASLTVWIWLCSSRASLVVTLAATTGRETPHARPSAVLEGTKT